MDVDETDLELTAHASHSALTQAQRDAIVAQFLDVPLGELAGRADAVVLVFGSASIFLRPTSDGSGTVEQPPHTLGLSHEFGGGHDSRIKGMTVRVAY